MKQLAYRKAMDVFTVDCTTVSCFVIFDLGGGTVDVSLFSWGGRLYAFD
jgi:molecular chaperone DnaK (HSP70)